MASNIVDSFIFISHYIRSHIRLCSKVSSLCSVAACYYIGAVAIVLWACGIDNLGVFVM